MRSPPKDVVKPKHNRTPAPQQSPAKPECVAGAALSVDRRGHDRGGTAAAMCTALGKARTDGQG